MQKPIALIVLLLCFFHVHSQTDSKLGKGIINHTAEDSSFSAKIGFRFQSLFSSDFKMDEQNKTTDDHSYFGIRRARLKLNGFAHSPKLIYKIEIGLANEDMGGLSEYSNDSPLLVLDAFVRWNFWKNLELWVGQTKLPGNRERLISSASLLLVDRSLLNSHFNIDRETGFQLHHHFNLSNNFVIREAFVISLGEGRNVTTGNIGGLNWTGRMEILPFGEFKNKGEYVGADIYREQKPKLALGMSFNYNDNAVKTRANRGSYMVTEFGFFETDIQSLYLDLMFKYQGFSVLAEYVDRKSTYEEASEYDGIKTGDVVNTGQALNLQAGYVFTNNYGLAARYTKLDFNELRFQNQTEYTLGISKFIVDHYLKVQTDVSYGEYETGFDSFRYRLLLELHL